ncbi:MAG TPA: carboxypeptidase-like regulatory domain-containing protein, partial [Terriglobales bacterium]|nr:carboxypeptidase-like regulatory domain-containing protein [Terriglobales bacterium]
MNYIFAGPKRWSGIGWLLLLISAVGAAAVPAYGQATNTGTIVGQVSDPQGAVVPGVTITVKDRATGKTLTTTTNEQGRYVMVNLPPATYDITASKQGFATAKVAAQAIQVGLTSTIDLKMTVGEVSTTVEVQASGVELQTMNATVGNTVSSIAINNLPSLGRDVSTFMTLQPGVSPDGNVAGAVMDQSTFQLDGGNNTNDMDGTMNTYTPSFAGDPTGGLVGGGPTGVMPTPADSVEEFKVNTTNQTADFNSSAGAQVQVVTKRGTNAWHGTAYEYYLDNNFSANTWDNNLSGTPVPDYHYNRFGGAVGGPIVPKSVLGGKTYLFANYQGFRWPNSTTFERAVPSANMRAGILTFGGVSYNINALDPRNIGVNPTIQKLWNTYEPAGNDPSCGALKGSKCDGSNEVGFKANVAIPQSDNFGVARLDHDFGQKWHFFGSYRYYRLTRATANQIDIGGFFSGDKLGVPTAVSNRPQVPWYYVAGLTTNITPTTTNDFHYSFLRNWWSWTDPGAPPQLSGLGGALEPFGESSTTALVPYNVNTQSTRTRFWDGQDHMV